MSLGEVVERYAQAIFELGEENNLLGSLCDGMATFARSYEQSAELREVLSNPLIPKDQVAQALRSVAQRSGCNESIRRSRPGVAVLGRVRGRDGRDGHDEREQDAARHAVADRDALVGEVADALGMGAVAVRRKRQHLAVAAAPVARVADKAAGPQRQGARRGRAEAAGLGRALDRDASAGRYPAPESHAGADRAGAGHLRATGG